MLRAIWLDSFTFTYFSERGVPKNHLFKMMLLSGTTHIRVNAITGFVLSKLAEQKCRDPPGNFIVLGSQCKKQYRIPDLGKEIILQYLSSVDVSYHYLVACIAQKYVKLSYQLKGNFTFHTASVP